MKPRTKYTKSGSINIAYQVFGMGTIDLVYIPGWVSNIDLMWDCPELVHFLEELGKVARVLLFDKRGTGLSDRVIELSTIEERMDDIRAVMDAADSKKAVLFGHSEGGSVSALFAATYPNRTISLITFGIFAKRVYAPHYPWAPTPAARQVVYDMIENSWGSGDMQLESLAPSKANDKVFMDWMSNYFRSGASPSAALVLTKMNTEVDIINILGSIKVPTLIMQRNQDIDVKIEEGRFIADRIEGARFVEFEGDDHMFWVGNTEEILEEMISFIVTSPPTRIYEKQLYTIITGRISTEINSCTHESSIRQYVAQYRGKVVKITPQTFTALFEGPSKAVHCGMEIVCAMQALQLEITLAIHIKECFWSESVSRETEKLTDTMLKNSRTGQIIITQTVKNLLVGAGLNFMPYKAIFEPETGEHFILFNITDKLEFRKQKSGVNRELLNNSDSFLERVLQSINNNLSNESYGVETLSREIGIGDRQLQRKLKIITNKSPNQLINSVRLHHARELLLSRHENVSEIAFRTGFANPSYFSKSFKKEFGIAPSELSNKHLIPSMSDLL